MRQVDGLPNCTKPSNHARQRVERMKLRACQLCAAIEFSSGVEEGELVTCFPKSRVSLLRSLFEVGGGGKS